MQAGNWLITSASAKVDLVRRMRAAAHDGGARLYVADADPLSASFCFADGSVVLPVLGHDDFLASLCAYCRSHNVGQILPTRDADVAYFAAVKERLEEEGICVLVSPLETVTLCLDKIAFQETCVRMGLPVLPRLEISQIGQLPCFVRCRVGAGGNGARRIESLDQLRLSFAGVADADLLVQPLVDLPEFTVDALFAPDGHAVQWIARERLRIRHGESCVGQTVRIEALDQLVLQMSERMSFAGPVTLQCFYSQETGPLLIEGNPRIGGAAALGIEAGLDTPARLVQLGQGDLDGFCRPRPLRYGLRMFRYAEDLFVDAPMKDSV
jgi:carbamoyl-phosphate synthase large subunit